MRKSINVFILDDDGGILEALTYALEIEGYKVHPFNTVKDFFHNFSVQIPDIVFLDILLSGQDGREVCQKIKQNKDTEHVPVVLMSASSNLEKDMEDSKADWYVKKPFDIDTLLETLQANV